MALQEKRPGKNPPIGVMRVNDVVHSSGRLLPKQGEER